MGSGGDVMGMGLSLSLALPEPEPEPEPEPGTGSLVLAASTQGGQQTGLGAGCAPVAFPFFNFFLI